MTRAPRRKRRVTTPVKHHAFQLRGACAGNCGTMRVRSRDALFCATCPRWFCAPCAAERMRRCACWPELVCAAGDGLSARLGPDADAGAAWCVECACVQDLCSACSACSRIACGKCCEACALEAELETPCPACGGVVCAACDAKGAAHACGEAASERARREAGLRAQRQARWFRRAEQHA
jgi:hypothetical protein